jgi:Tfp pilus assembly protein PilN
MRAVNLLPEGARDTHPTVLTQTTAGIGAGVLAALVAVVLSFVYVHDHGTVSDKEKTLSALRQEIVDIQVATARTEASQGADQARLSAFTTAASGRVAWDVLLDQISRVLPSGSWLSTLDVQGGAAATTDPATVPTAFTVSGTALTQNTVAQVMDRLGLVPMLTGVTLQGSSRTAVGETEAYQFTVSANVRLVEEAQ